MYLGYAYNAWGKITAQGNDPLYEQNPFRYRGYYYDEETGFYFLNSRYYDPQVKRFISADCLFVAGDAITGANMYAYCDNNPVMRVDPTGMKSELWELSAAIAIGGLMAAAFQLLYKIALWNNKDYIPSDAEADALVQMLDFLHTIGQFIKPGYENVVNVVNALTAFVIGLENIWLHIDEAVGGIDWGKAVSTGAWAAIIAAGTVGLENAAIYMGIAQGDPASMALALILSGGAFVFGFIGSLIGQGG